MRSEYEIKEDLRKARAELDRLNKWSVNDRTINQDLTQGEGIHMVTETRGGSVNEIRAAEQKVARLEAELEQRYKYDLGAGERKEAAAAERDRRKAKEKAQRMREKEEAKREDRKKQKSLEDFKKAYKETGAWNRIVNRVKHQTPDWKKVRQLSKEELDVLTRVMYGTAAIQDGKYSTKPRTSKAKRERSHLLYEQMRNMLKHADARKKAVEAQYGPNYSGKSM